MESLPDHLLVEIFDYLDTLSIKCAEDVCERWRQIITTSSRIISKFSFISYSYGPISQSIQEQLRQVNEQFDHIEAVMMHYTIKNVSIDLSKASKVSHDRLFEIARKYFKRMEKLEFVAVHNVIVVKIVSLTPSTLVELKINSRNDDGLDELLPICLPKLKTLGIANSTKILNLINAPNIAKLFIENCQDRASHLERFILKLSKLKFIEIREKFVANFLNFTDFPFRLVHLKVRDIKDPNFIHFFQKFSFPQRENLKKLEVNNVEFDSKTLLAFAIGSLKLESLIFSGHFIVDRDMEIINDIPENSTVKHLEISFPLFRNIYPRFVTLSEHRAYFNSFQVTVINKCKAVEKLKIDGLGKNSDQFLMEIQSDNLKILENRRLPVQIIPEFITTISIDPGSTIEFNDFKTKFPNLKKLIFEYENIENTNNFFKYFHKIDEIEIKQVRNDWIHIFRAIVDGYYRMGLLRMEVYGRDVKKIEEIFKIFNFKVELYHNYDW